jgi:hypothetical protein
MSTPINEIDETSGMVNLIEKTETDIYSTMKTLNILEVSCKKVGFILNKINYEDATDALRIFRDSIKYSKNKFNLKFIVNLLEHNQNLFRNKLHENIQDYENETSVREFIDLYMNANVFDIITVMEIPIKLNYLKIYIDIINFIGCISSMIDNVREIFLTEFDSRETDEQIPDHFNFIEIEKQIYDIDYLLKKMYS